MPSNPPPDRIPLGGADAAALVPMTREAAGRLGTIFAAMEPWSRYPYPADVLAAYLALVEAHAPRFAIVEGDDVRGAVGVQLAWLRGPYLQFLGIVPECQGNGLGGAVLAWLERDARRCGHRNLFVCTSDFNAGAERFYARHGFARAAVLDGLVLEGTAEILLRKRLTRPDPA